MKSQFSAGCDTCLHEWAVVVRHKTENDITAPDFSECPRCSHPCDLRGLKLNDDDDHDDHDAPGDDDDDDDDNADGFNGIFSNA